MTFNQSIFHGSDNTLRKISALICREGVTRGYDVIPEFKYNSGGILFDIVWCLPLPSGTDEEYKLVALFEIEGADVPISDIRRPNSKEKGLRRHYLNFKLLPEIPDSLKLVVLYTQAFDRKWANERDYRKHISDRKNDAVSYPVTIISGEELPDYFRQLKVIGL